MNSNERSAVRAAYEKFKQQEYRRRLLTLTGLSMMLGQDVGEVLTYWQQLEGEEAKGSGQGVRGSGM